MGRRRSRERMASIVDRWNLGWMVILGGLAVASEAVELSASKFIELVHVW